MRMSPRLLMRKAESFPFLIQRLIVRGVTRKILATSLAVSKSGQSSPKVILLLLYHKRSYCQELFQDTITFSLAK